MIIACSAGRRPKVRQAASGDASLDRAEIPPLPTTIAHLRFSESAFLAAGKPSRVAEAMSVPTSAELTAIVAEASQRWVESGLVDAQAVARLGRIHLQFCDLDGLMLGKVEGDTLWLDCDAAGHGWFGDGTPAENEEFRQQQRQEGLTASAGSLAEGRMDLLTVVSHEVGHLLGFAHVDNLSSAARLMGDTLAAGVRLSPAPRVHNCVDKGSGDPAVAGASRTAPPRIDWTKTWSGEIGLGSARRGKLARVASLQPGQEVAPWLHDDKKVRRGADSKVVSAAGAAAPRIDLSSSWRSTENPNQGQGARYALRHPVHVSREALAWPSHDKQVDGGEQTRAEGSREAEPRIDWGGYWPSPVVARSTQDGTAGPPVSGSEFLMRRI